MKTFLDICLEVGNDMKDKFEKGEQIRYKDYLTTENKSILETLSKSRFEDPVFFKNETSRLDSNVDEDTLMYFARFIADLSYEFAHYGNLLGYGEHSKKTMDIVQTLRKKLNHEFKHAKNTKELQPLIQYLDNNSSSIIIMAVKNPFTTSYSRLDELKKIDTNHELLPIRNKMSSSFNQETFQF